VPRRADGQGARFAARHSVLRGSHLFGAAQGVQPQPRAQQLPAPREQAGRDRGGAGTTPARARAARHRACTGGVSVGIGERGGKETTEPPRNCLSGGETQRFLWESGRAFVPARNPPKRPDPTAPETGRAAARRLTSTRSKANLATDRRTGCKNVQRETSELRKTH